MSGTGAALADLTYALTAFVFGTFLQHHIGANQGLFKFFSTLLLSAFGIWMIIGSIKAGVKNKEITVRISMLCKKPLISTYLMTIANPLTIIVFSGFSGQIMAHDVVDVISCSLMLFAGSLLVQMLLAALGAILRPYLLKPVILRSMNLLSGTAIVFIALLKYIS